MVGDVVFGCRVAGCQCGDSILGGLFVARELEEGFGDELAAGCGLNEVAGALGDELEERL